MHKIDRYLTKIITFLIILLPISITAGKAVGDIFASLTGILFLLQCFIKKDYPFIFEKWVTCALILWIYSIVRSLFSFEPSFALAKTVPWVRFIFFAAAIQYYLSKNNHLIKKLLISTTIAVIFLVSDSLFQYMIGTDFFGRPLSQEGGFVRLTGPFSKMIVGYIITSLALPVISYIIFKFKSFDNFDVRKITLLAAIFIIYLTVFLSGERSAFIQITFGIAMIILAAKITPKTIITIFLFIIAVTIISYALMPQEFQRQVLSVYHTARHFNESAYGILWNSGVRLGIHNLFLGIGPNNYELECLKVATFCRSHPHNIFIEWFAEFGIIGLSLFLCFICTIIFEVRRFYFGIEKKYYKYILFGLLATFTAKLLPLPSSGFFKNWYAVPFWFTIGWMMSFKNPYYCDEKFKH